MVSIQGSSPINESNNGQSPKVEPQQQDNSNNPVFSKYDENKDGLVSREEQQTYFLKTVSDFYIETFKSFGQSIVDFVMNNKRFKDISTDGTKISALEADVAVRIINNDVHLDALDHMDSLIAQKANSTATEKNDSKDEEIDELFNKLVQKGINFLDIDVSELSDIMSKFDYDICVKRDDSGNESFDPVIQPNSAKSHGLSDYMNKDDNGNIQSTHYLDMLANKYIATRNK